uniref:U1756o n=1 Tax=Mycobacterium leprae TaxID=1769 RepID=Q49960_MYCLR|nr:u1756o [Mycobacterium leprae]
MSTWVEHTAVLGAHAIIAVSSGMLRIYPTLDPRLVHVIWNAMYSIRPGSGTVRARYRLKLAHCGVRGTDGSPDRKGVAHLATAAHRFSPDV